MTYALLVPQSPYKIAAARFQSTLRGRLMLVGIKFHSETRLARATGGLTSASTASHRSSCSLMMLTRLAVGLEPLNAPDAAHRSPRSAPLWARSEFGSPVGSATRRSINRNKEPPKYLIESN